MSNKYLVYNTLEDALVKADEEGRERNYAYFSQPNGVTRYKTYPKLLKNGKYSLEVSDYISLTSEEDSSTVTKVTFPTPEI